MRVSDSCVLVLVLQLLISIFCSYHIQAFPPSGTLADEVLVVRYHNFKQLKPMKENAQINLEKERRYGGNTHVSLEPKTLVLTARKLLMKQGVSREEASNSGNIHRNTKISHGRRSMKRVNKKGLQRDEGEGVGVFTEDYRVPRPHPPRNN